MNNKNTALLNYLLAWPKSAIVSEIWASFVRMAGKFLSHVPCFISVQSNFKFSNTLAAHLRYVLYMLFFFSFSLKNTAKNTINFDAYAMNDFASILLTTFSDDYINLQSSLLIDSAVKALLIL